LRGGDKNFIFENFYMGNLFFLKKYFLRGGDKKLFLKIFTWEIYFF
jgi:hypothetical protein